MPSPISRVGDQNQLGGHILSGATTVLAEGQPVGLHPSAISPHGPWDTASHPPHQAAQTLSGSATVIIEGKPALMVGSTCTCGHCIIQGASTVIIS